MIDFRSLEVFYWVAQLGSFRRAAEKLNMTQPSISARIAQLEHQLKVRLLERGSGGAVLTPKGIDLLSYAERLLTLRTDLVMAITDRAAVRGTVRVGASETIVHTWLSMLVRQVHETYPLVTLEIVVDISPNLRDQLVGSELDVALLLGPVAAPRVRNTPLCEFPLCWMASPSIALPAEPVALADLARWPLITYSRATRPYLQIADLFNRSDLPPVRLFGNSSLSSIVKMTVDGIGVCAIPTAVVAEELASGKLRQIMTEAEAQLPPLVFTASHLNTPDHALAAAVATLAKSAADAWQSSGSP